MRKSLVLAAAVVGACALGADARADLPAPRLVNPALLEPATDVRPRPALPPSAAKVKDILKADPRVGALNQAILAAAAIRDKAARKAALDKLGPQILAVRTDAIKKAGVDAAAVDKAVKAIGPLVRPAAFKPQPGAVLGTTTITSFPKPYSYKRECTDGGDGVDFDGAVVKVHGASAVGDKDCDVVRGGRTGSVQVPKGASRMMVQVSAKVDLDVLAIHYGAFAEASGHLGVRIFSPAGVTLSTQTIAGKSIDIPGAVQRLGTGTVYASSFGLNPIPFSTDGFADDLQEGDQGSAVTFDLPANVDVGTLEVTLFAQGMADADLSGLAASRHDITPKSLKVTFYK